MGEDSSTRRIGDIDRLIAEAEPKADVAALKSVRNVQARLFGAEKRPVAVSRYVLLDSLGSGGMGVVYRAYDPELDRRVAVKLLHSGVPSDERTDRFLREARALARLSHRNVVAIHDMGSYDESDLGLGQMEDARRLGIPPRGLFIVMDLVEGEDLRAWMAAGARAWREVIEVFLQAGRGLAAAHRAGMIHRDFKPANVVIGVDGTVRVLDFGLARALFGETSEPSAPQPPPAEEPTSEELTETGTLLGTPAYMSPEQHAREPVDARSDQYAFAVALFEALWGRRPFEGSIAEIAKAKAGGRIAFPAGRRVPRRVREAVERALQPRPAGRFSTMDGLLAALSPASSVQRSIALGLGVAVVGTGLALAYWTDPAQKCAELAAQIDGVWDGARRRAIETQMLATGLPFAADTFATVAARLDDHSARWVAQREQACEAALLTGSTPPRAAEGRALCLDRQLGAMGDVLWVLEHADADVVENAVRLVNELQAPEDCLGRSLGTPAIHTPEQRETLAAIDGRLARARALEHAAKYTKSLAEATAALEAARTAALPVAEARALTMVGRLHRELGNRRQAAEHLDEAWRVAEQARIVESEIDPMLELAVIHTDRGEFVEARRLLQLTEAKLTHVGEDAELWARFHVEAGLLDHKEAAHEAALAHYEQALVLYTRRFGDNDPRVAEIYGHIGGLHSERGEHQMAHEALERSRRAIEAAYGPHHPMVARTLNSLANTLESLGELERALDHFETAESIMREALHDGHPDIALPMNNAGNVLMRGRRYEDAAAKFRGALEIKRAELGDDHPQLALFLGNYARALSAAGDPARALPMHRRAVSLRQVELGAEHPSVGYSQLLLAETLFALERHREALQAIAEAERLWLAHYGPQHPSLVEAHALRGRIALKRGRLREAVDTLERALDLSDAVGRDADPLRTADIEFLLAQALVELDRAAAVEYARKSLHTFSETQFTAAAAAEVSAWLESMAAN